MIDGIILGVVALGLLVGLSRGLVKQLASILGLVAGLLVARALFVQVGSSLAPTLGTSTTVAQMLAFVLIWVLVPVIFTAIASVLTRVLDVVCLGWLNRLMGGVLGALTGLVMMGVAIQVVEFIDPNDHLVTKQEKRTSQFYRPIRKAYGEFFPVFKNVTEQLIEL